MRKYISLIFVLFTFAFLKESNCEPAGKPKAISNASRRIVYVGDRIRYSIKIIYADGQEIKLADFENGKIGDFEIKESGSDARSLFFARRELVYWFDIAAYEIGKRDIPEAEILYRDKGSDKWDFIKTLSVSIDVRSVLPETKTALNIKDIKGPVGFFEINPIFAGILIVTIILVSLYIIKKMRKKAPVRLPHEIALEELEAARGDHLKGLSVKEYYVSVSDCVRRYIERVFRLKAPEMTTEEFLDSLSQTNALRMEHKSLLREFLNACDLVKFAKHAPSIEEIESVYNTAKKFVEETKDIYAHI